MLKGTQQLEHNLELPIPAAGCTAEAALANKVCHAAPQRFLPGNVCCDTPDVLLLGMAELRWVGPTARLLFLSFPFRKGSPTLNLLLFRMVIHKLKF